MLPGDRVVCVIPWAPDYNKSGTIVAPKGTQDRRLIWVDFGDGRIVGFPVVSLIKEAQLEETSDDRTTDK
jgi:hypothetical protein